MANPTVETAIWMALRGRVESLVLTPALQVVWPGETVEPTADHISVMNITAPPVRLLVGNGPHERIGTLQLSYKTALQALNYANAQEVAGLIAEHFPVDLMLHFSPVQVRVTQAPAVADGFRDEGFWHVPVRVRWQAFA